MSAAKPPASPRASLLEAERLLDQTIETLVLHGLRPVPHRTPYEQSLAAAAGLLRRATAVDEQTTETVRRIQLKSRQAALLLTSALSYHQGWFQTRPAAEQHYGPDGQWRDGVPGPAEAFSLRA